MPLTEYFESETAGNGNSREHGSRFYHSVVTIHVSSRLIGFEKGRSNIWNVYLVMYIVQCTGFSEVSGSFLFWFLVNVALGAGPQSVLNWLQVTCCDLHYS